MRIADLPRHHVWSQFVAAQGLTGVNIERGLVFDTAVLAAQYALSGQGIALVDTNLFAEETQQRAPGEALRRRRSMTATATT